MTTQTERISQAKEDTERLRRIAMAVEEGSTVQASEIDAIAFRLDKLVTFVVDRDAGPSLDVKAEANDLREKLEIALREKAEEIEKRQACEALALARGKQINELTAKLGEKRANGG